MSERLDAIREKLAAVPEGWVGGWFMASDVAYLLAELDKARAASVVHVSHYDMEARAAHFNEGYETAMSQHLADDPSAAEDWLNGKLAEAWDEGWAARAKRPHLGMHESVPAPSHINPYRKEAP